MAITRAQAVRLTRQVLRRGVAVLARPMAASVPDVLTEIDAGRIDRAGEMLRLRPVDASAYYLRGRIAEHQATTATVEEAPSHWQRAVGHYRRALRTGRGPVDPAETRYRLALALVRLKQPAAAGEVMGQAIDLAAAAGEIPMEWRYQRGRILELRGNGAAAREAYRDALAADPTNPAFLADVLDTTPKNFLYRQQVGRFVVDHLAEIRAQADAFRADPGGLDRPVFLYWAQGFAVAPAVVQTCVGKVRAVVPADRLHLLTRDTVRSYVDLPEQVWELGETDPAHFSDALRAALLARYGGVWLDATCYPGPGFLEQVDELLQAEYFAFRYHSARISSWFMVSEPGGYLARSMDAALRVYWTVHRSKLHYFLYHYLFEALYWADPEFRRRWDTCPVHPTRVPHRLQHRMYHPSAEHDLDALVSTCFVHKLSWKVDPTLMHPDTVMAALMRREHAQR